MCTCEIVRVFQYISTLSSSSTAGAHPKTQHRKKNPAKNVRAAQFVFVCGWRVGVGGEGGGRLKAVGFFAAAALGKGRHWAPVLVHCCSHCRRGEVGHATGVFNTHVCNRVGGVVVAVVGGSI